MNEVLAIDPKEWGQGYVSTNATGKPASYVKRVVGLLVISLLALWYFAPPRVVIYYSKDGHEVLSYILNTQHRNDKGTLAPGETTGNTGHIFPDEKFFMEFYWWSDQGRNHCVNITPKWPTTETHLDSNGNINSSKGSGTDIDRLKQCITDTSKP